jgi:hypothetical protein
VSREAIRQILHDAGISWLATKTWKTFTDPQFIAKMRRVLDLYDHPPVDGRVICADICRHRPMASAACGVSRPEAARMSARALDPSATAPNTRRTGASASRIVKSSGVMCAVRTRSVTR